MAKGYKKNPVVIPQSVKVPDVFTTSHGYKLHIHSIPQMLIDKVRNSVQMPDPPTYDATLASGEVIKLPHDLTTLETDDEKYLWQQYEASVKEAQKLSSKRMTDTLILKGIEKIDLPEDNTWREDQEYLGIVIPTNERELYVHYVSTEILYTAEDFYNLSEMIMRSTGVSEEKLAEAQASFRSQMASKETADTSEESEDSGG
jgi:hypothetical protein